MFCALRLALAAPQVGNADVHISQSFGVMSNRQSLTHPPTINASKLFFSKVFIIKINSLGNLEKDIIIYVTPFIY